MQLFVSSPPFLREIHLSVMVQTAGFLWLSSGEAEIVPFDSKERRRGELHETFVPFFFRFGCFQKASKWMVELLKSSLKLMIWGGFPTCGMRCCTSLSPSECGSHLIPFLKGETGFILETRIYLEGHPRTWVCG